MKARYIMRIIFVIILIGVSYITRVAYRFLKYKYAGIYFPLFELNKRLYLFQQYSLNGASITVDYGRNTPFLEFKKIMGPNISTRVQMILRREDHMKDAYDKAREALTRISVPFIIKERHLDSTINMVDKESMTINKVMNNKNISNYEILFVDCGRNLDLANACAYAVLVEGFGISTGSNIRLRIRGPHYYRGKGWCSYDETLKYKVTTKGDVIKTIKTILKKLEESCDEEAFVMFGCNSRPIPIIRKCKIGNETTFLIDWPSFDRTSQNALKMMREEGHEIKKHEQTEYGPIYRIWVGSSKEDIAALFKQMLSIKVDYDVEGKVSYRFVEVITTDWKPSDTDIEETKA